MTTSADSSTTTEPEREIIWLHPTPRGARWMHLMDRHRDYSNALFIGVIGVNFRLLWHEADRFWGWEGGLFVAWALCWGYLLSSLLKERRRWGKQARIGIEGSHIHLHDGFGNHAEGEIEEVVLRGGVMTLGKIQVRYEIRSNGWLVEPFQPFDSALMELHLRPLLPRAQTVPPLRPDIAASSTEDFDNKAVNDIMIFGLILMVFFWWR